jgi:anthranilate synthase component 1
MFTVLEKHKLLLTYSFLIAYDFKIFGSSPEAQIIVKNRKAEIHLIAGTFKELGMMKRCKY